MKFVRFGEIIFVVFFKDMIRELKDGEEDGKNYFFVFVEDMLMDIEVNKYLEYGMY